MLLLTHTREQVFMRRRCRRQQLIMWMKQNAVIIIFTKYTKFNQTLSWFMVAIQFIQLALQFNLLHERARNAFAFECEMGGGAKCQSSPFLPLALSSTHRTACVLFCLARAHTHAHQHSAGSSSLIKSTEHWNGFVFRRTHATNSKPPLYLFSFRWQFAVRLDRCCDNIKYER